MKATMSPADIAAHVAAQGPVRRPTAPLPPAAVEALSRLELRLAPAGVVQAVTQFEVAAERARELAAVAASGSMTDLDADSLAAAEALMDGARSVLADAGQLHLIGGDR